MKKPVRRQGRTDAMGSGGNVGAQHAAPLPAKTAPRPSDTWRFLPPPLVAVTARLGFAKPTPVQETCLPPALEGKSFAAVAPTGTGKTLAYLLPLWERLNRPSREGRPDRSVPGGGARGPRASGPRGRSHLILVPARELGYQVSQMLQQIDARARDGLVLCLGGHDLDSQKRRLAGDWHTVIATPGRLIDVLDALPDLLRDVDYLVLDEFDRLIDMGFEEQVGRILARLPRKRQTLLFSATGADDALERLPLGDLARHHVHGGKSAPLSETFYYLKSNRTKNDLLLAALKDLDTGAVAPATVAVPETAAEKAVGKKNAKAGAGSTAQALVFVANREKANHLNGLLRLRGVSSGALHGDRLQSERALAYQGFKDGKFKVLVATDLAARGLDIPEVDLVVNYDLPRNFREYVHRSGRAARRKRPGSCLSFAGPDEYLALRNIQRDFGGPLPVHPDYAQAEPWLIHAKRVHEAKVRAEQRAEFIRREQGLPEPVRERRRRG